MKRFIGNAFEYLCAATDVEAYFNDKGKEGALC